MATKQEIMFFITKSKKPVCALDISKNFDYPIGTIVKEQLSYHPATISNNMYSLEKSGVLICTHKEGRRKYFKISDETAVTSTSIPTEEPTTETTPTNPNLPTLDSGEPIPEKYQKLFFIDPPNDDIAATINNIRLKILTDGILTPEQEEYMNAKVDEIQKLGME